MTRMLDRDPISGAWETFDYDDADDQVIVKRFMDVEPILNMNKRMQTVGFDRREVMWHVGCIPDIITEKWLVEDGVNVLRKENWPWLRRKLNDPDWRWLNPHGIKV
jgi:hypothetical protein